MTRQMICQAVAGISDEYVAEAAEYTAARVSRKLRRWLTVAASLLLAVGMGWFSVWFFAPSDMLGSSDQAMITTMVRIDDKMAFYNRTDVSRYDEVTMKSRQGELYRQHGGTDFYRVKGAEDLAYLICENGEDRYLMEFESWMEPMPAEWWQGSAWYVGGHVSDEDVAALSPDAKITYGDTLRIIYGVESGEGIESVKFTDADIDNTDIGERVKVKSVTLRDGESMERIYAVLCGLSNADVSRGWVRIFADDEEYKNGTQPLSEQTERDVIVTLKSGRRLKFNYSSTSSRIKTRLGGFGAVLDDADNDWLISAAGIDMQYRYYGDAPHYGGGETATPDEADETFSE